MRYLIKSIYKSVQWLRALESTVTIQFWQDTFQVRVLLQKDTLLLWLIYLFFFCHREKKMKIQDIKNNIKEAIEVNLWAIVFNYSQLVI